MNDVKFTWRGDKVAKEVTSVLEARLQRVGPELRTHIVRKISEGRTRTEGPSEPDTPPHVDTGRLRQSIFWRFLKGELTVIVGTNLLYGLWLELGTSLMAARPYIRQSLLEMLPRIRQILTSKKG